MKRQLWLQPHEWKVVAEALYRCYCTSHTADTVCVTVGKYELRRLQELVTEVSKAQPPREPDRS